MAPDGGHYASGLGPFDPAYQAAPQKHPQYAHMMARGPLPLLAHALKDPALMKRAVVCEDFPGLVIRLLELAGRGAPSCFEDTAAKAKACLQLLQEDSAAGRKVNRAEELLRAAVRAGRRGATGGACAPLNINASKKGAEEYFSPAFKSWELDKLRSNLPEFEKLIAETRRTGQDPSEEQIRRVVESMGALGGNAPRPQGQRSSHRVGSSSSSSGVKSKVTKAACVVCGACQGATSACSRCKSVWYCTKAHQVGGVRVSKGSKDSLP